MRPSSAKAKGRRLQQLIRDVILSVFKQLEPDDVKVAIMGESGEDIKLSPAARRVFPYSVECKNVEKLNIWSALEQAEENTKTGTTSLLVFKRNHSKTYVALELDTFMKLAAEKTNEETHASARVPSSIDAPPEGPTA